MCGRYTHLLTWSKIAELYRLTLPDEEPKGLTLNYNVAPTTVMPIIRPAGNGRGLVMELTRSISLASRNSPAAGVAGRALSRTSHPAASWHGRGKHLDRATIGYSALRSIVCVALSLSQASCGRCSYSGYRKSPHQSRLCEECSYPT